MRIKEKRIGQEAFDMLNLDINHTADESCEVGDFILIVGQDFETRLLLRTLLELW